MHEASAQPREASAHTAWAEEQLTALISVEDGGNGSGLYHAASLSLPMEVVDGVGVRIDLATYREQLQQKIGIDFVLDEHKYWSPDPHRLEVCRTVLHEILSAPPIGDKKELRTKEKGTVLYCWAASFRRALAAAGNARHVAMPDVALDQQVDTSIKLAIKRQLASKTLKGDICKVASEVLSTTISTAVSALGRQLPKSPTVQDLGHAIRALGGKLYGAGTDGVSEAWGVYVFQVLQRVHPGKLITPSGFMAINELVTDLLVRLLDGSAAAPLEQPQQAQTAMDQPPRIEHRRICVHPGQARNRHGVMREVPHAVVDGMFVDLLVETPAHRSALLQPELLTSSKLAEATKCLLLGELGKCAESYAQTALNNGSAAGAPMHARAGFRLGVQP